MPFVYSVEMNSVVFFFDIACGILYAHTHTYPSPYIVAARRGWEK